MTLEKAFSTFSPSSALVSKNAMLFFWAYEAPISVDTYLKC